MQLLESTRRNQSALASYCRTGKKKAIPGVNKDNISQYRRLVFDIIDDMLQSAYPLTHDLLSHKEWNQLAKEFLSNHSCSSPQVWYMPKELHEYLAALPNHPLLTQYPYLLELLWFEWLEVELYMMADKTTSYRSSGNVDTDLLVLNPESHFEHFTYPVHLKNAVDIIPTDQANYYLAAHRIPTTGAVLFTSLSPALLYMLELLLDKPYTTSELTQITCKTLNINFTDEVLATTTHFINTSLQTQLLIGFAEKAH